ncbi:MAG: hypothetical protein A3F14_02505 [Gammaproteobacteria bacterium RIFCSPHIGHO2_12_FULL_43_28]|nr:MAG: hypothetical protein A3F14_02505 [Gammaproteobacteria bacterium RIFCSPHIGHO2_12_FULL_43_28]
MPQFKFLPASELETNFNALAGMVLKKHGAENDLRILEKANKVRFYQLSLIEELIEISKELKLSDSEKSKLITGAMLQVQADILHTYMKLKQIMPSMIRSIMYHNIDGAIGISADNQLDEGSRKEAIDLFNKYKKMSAVHQREVYTNDVIPKLASVKRTDLKHVETVEKQHIPTKQEFLNDVIPKLASVKRTDLKHVETVEKQQLPTKQEFLKARYEGLFFEKNNVKKPVINTVSEKKDKKHSKSKGRKQFIPSEEINKPHPMETRSGRRPK